MSASGLNINRTALSGGMQQYERLAVFEAVLTLRDKRNRSRTQWVGIALGVMGAAALTAVYWV